MQNIASLIDHTILKAEATRDDVMRLCDEALQHGFASVCVNGTFVKDVREKLAGSEVKTCGVAGFPLGAMKPMVKAIEATSLRLASARSSRTDFTSASRRSSSASFLFDGLFGLIEI